MDEDVRFFLLNDDTDILRQYSNLLSEAYGKYISYEFMLNKHISNPLGSSIISYALNSEGKLIAARAFWRMYNESVVTYQPCDTITHKDYQGKGLFTKLTRICLNELPGNALVINFPNNQSLPGYLKLGWAIKGRNVKRFSLNLRLLQKKYSKISGCLPAKLDSKYKTYLNWRFSNKLENKYTFYKAADGIVIDNGDQTGLIRFGFQSCGRNRGPGLTKGYFLRGQYSLKQLILSLSLPLNCNSRTVFYPSSKQSSHEIDDLIAYGDVNIFMDTF
ncbi:hypothetical protein RC083_20990 [Pseudoalteromonas haloplanktis]|uniref:N-acetyltransferase domain-containing protein n=1 Tax=Pseudoalteromonas haloplanktis TaxID=228 RepID=A0ABU1BIB3_PSEHA|nr:hypothetical protein [Pseudoalteromonas haloplanktis]MDQ9094042.1 hypothetical protein [Pseudoalteromonas haloplanktis]